jgi:hypothetical protein
VKKSAFARLATWRVLAIVVGVAAFVLGAKAGCERYEQIRTQAAAIPVVGFDGEPLLVNLGDGSGEDGVGERLFPRGCGKSPHLIVRSRPR